MQAGEVVRSAWELYKAHWRTFIPLAAIVYVILGLVTLVLAALLGAVGAVIGALVNLVGVFWLQGALVEAVRDVRDGRQDLSIQETFNRVRPHLPAIIVAGLLAGIAIVIGLILLIVPGLFLLTIWCLIVPAIVLEGKSAGESFSRSRELVRGHGWSVFGVIVITFVAIILANIVVSLALIWLPEEVRGFFQSLVANTLVGPFFAVALTLTYYALVRPEPATVDATPMAPQPPPPA